MDLVSFRRVLLVFTVLALPACNAPFWSAYRINGLSKEKFTHYVENVFRLQNRLTSQTMMLMEGDDANKQYAPLLLVEQNMHKACRFLNEYASRENEHLSIGLLLQRRVEKTAQDCEQSANKLEALLGERYD